MTVQGLDLSPFARRHATGPDPSGPHHEGAFNVPLDIYI